MFCIIVQSLKHHYRADSLITLIETTRATLILFLVPETVELVTTTNEIKLNVNDVLPVFFGLLLMRYILRECFVDHTKQ
jgi:hypothetical protein